MTLKQKLWKAVYPLLMWWTKRRGKNVTALSGSNEPLMSFYSLKGTLNNGKEFEFASLRGKKVMLVNTASDCGYTNQYEDLQKISEQFKDKLVVLGFPANDFKQQEKGTDEEIAQFCQLNFGVKFPLMKKSSVIRSAEQNPVYQWLTDPAKNGWNKKTPPWNFAKYIINEQGILTHYFGASVPPTDKKVIQAIEE